MRVLHIVRQYLPSVGGMEEVVRNLVRHQHHDSDYEPRIVTLNRVFRQRGQALPRHEVLDGIPVHRLGYVGSERYPLCPQVLRDVGDVDLVHVHGIDFFFDYLALTRVFHGKPMIASTHGGFFHSNFAMRLKQLYFRSVTRLSALAYQRVVCTSENDAHLFGKVVSEERLRVIENGVDVKKFYDCASHALLPRLLYFGRWSVNKGLLETLDVLAALVSQYPEVPWYLTIAGREYDLHAQALLTQAQLRGIGHCIGIVANPSNQTLRAHMAQSSYFICQSRHEGFGIAPIEAMSAGLIPLLSNIPPFHKLVQTSGVGLLLGSTTATLQAQQIYQLHQRHALQDGGAATSAKTLRTHAYTTARNAARAAAEPYAWTGVARQYTLQYDSILGPQ